MMTYPVFEGEEKTYPVTEKERREEPFLIFPEIFVEISAEDHKEAARRYKEKSGLEEAYGYVVREKDAKRLQEVV